MHKINTLNISLFNWNPIKLLSHLSPTDWVVGAVNMIMWNYLTKNLSLPQIRGINEHWQCESDTPSFPLPEIKFNYKEPSSYEKLDRSKDIRMYKDIDLAKEIYVARSGDIVFVSLCVWFSLTPFGRPLTFLHLFLLPFYVLLLILTRFFTN